MRMLALALALTLLGPSRVSAEPPVPLNHLGPHAAIWGARSCVGEAGWGSWRGECRAILGVYVARWRAMQGEARPGLTLVRVIRAYSSAVKRGEWHRRPWIFGLAASLDRPRGWPLAAAWRSHRDDWGHVLANSHAFLEGLTQTPCPGAQHYGNRTTDGRPRGHVRVQCSVPTRNRFWGRR